MNVEEKRFFLVILHGMDKLGAVAAFERPQAHCRIVHSLSLRYRLGLGFAATPARRATRLYTLTAGHRQLQRAYGIRSDIRTPFEA